MKSSDSLVVRCGPDRIDQGPEDGSREEEEETGEASSVPDGRQTSGGTEGGGRESQVSGSGGTSSVPVRTGREGGRRRVRRGRYARRSITEVLVVLSVAGRSPGSVSDTGDGLYREGRVCRCEGETTGNSEASLQWKSVRKGLVGLNVGSGWDRRG